MSRSTSTPVWIQVLSTLLVAAWATSAGAVAEAEPMEAEEESLASEAMPAEPAPAEPAPAEAEASAPAAQGTLARSGFTTAVVEREPVDGISTLSNDQEEVAYFTELRGFEGHTVVHRWEHGGEVKAEVPFEVGGERWRVHSTKRLDPAWLGTWTVSVVVDGQVISQEEFSYTAAPVAADAPAESPALPDEETPGSAPAAPATE